MIVAAHQPHYLPWLGYLHKLALCDVFVVVDDVQYEAQNYQNRNRLKVNNGTTWLTVPLEHASQEEPICARRISYRQSPKEHWQRRTFATLRIHYGRAPYFDRYADELRAVYTCRWERLVDLDLHLLALFMRWLGIEKPIVRASTLGVTGQKTDRILQMVRAVGGDTYLSGRGGSMRYLDEERLRAGGVRVAWQSFHHPVYPQRYPRLGFVPNLGALDLLLNCGPSSREILFGATEPRSIEGVVATAAAGH